MKTTTRRFLAGVGLFCGLTALAEAQEGPESTERALQDLLEDHPEARVEFSRGESPRARSVFGTPMTRAERPEEAADDFLARYGAAFVDGRAEFELVESFGRLKGGRVLHYRQTIEGVPVDGSIVRVLVHEEAEALPAVAYASGHFARPPALGLPDPVITGREALTIAQFHPTGQLLDEWADPELVATTTSGVLSRGEARLAWRVDGFADAASWGFWIDAQSGELFRETDRAAHYQTPSPPVTVSGTVSGGITPGTEPDKPVGHRCGANLPVPGGLPDLLVEITDATQSTVLDSTYTNDLGIYSFFGTTYPVDAKIRFSWSGPAWTMFEDLPGGACNPTSIPPFVKDLGSSFPVVHNHDYNPSPYTEFNTSKSNLQANLSLGRTFFLDRLPPNSYPALNTNLTVIANSCQGAVFCSARYFPGPMLGQDAVAYGAIDSPTCDFNRAYSTIAVHEYGHYVAHRVFGIDPVVPHRDFHEGVADALAMLVHDVTIYAENWEANCDPDRSPLTAIPRPEFDCAYEAWHDDGMLLSAIWLELAEAPVSGGASGGIGLAAARQLFVDWGLLTAGGIEDGPVGCETDEKAAGPATLIEVLMADDDDGALNNGTPNDSVICRIFAARGISSGSSPCGSPFTGGECVVDLDQSGTVDVYDVLVFLAWMHDGDLLADWDGDGVVTVVDALAFANDFEEGC